MVRLTGHILLWLGFFVGAFYMVRSVEVEGNPWSTIDWRFYIGAVVVGCIGVVILQVTARSAGTQSHKLDEDMQTLTQTLNRVLEKLDAMIVERETVSVFAIHEWIDRELAVDLGKFADARKAMMHRFGLPAYAGIMTEFATAERSINRAWSASADGYIDEVWLSLDRAQRRMHRAKELFDANGTTA
jgi:hypothetical protein